MLEIWKISTAMADSAPGRRLAISGHSGVSRSVNTLEFFQIPYIYHQKAGVNPKCRHFKFGFTLRSITLWWGSRKYVGNMKHTLEYSKYIRITPDPTEISPKADIPKSFCFSTAACPWLTWSLSIWILSKTFYPLWWGSRKYVGNMRHLHGHSCLGARSAPSHQWSLWCLTFYAIHPSVDMI